jgi:hypothetical protein
MNGNLIFYRLNQHKYLKTSMNNLLYSRRFSLWVGFHHVLRHMRDTDHVPHVALYMVVSQLL